MSGLVERPILSTDLAKAVVAECETKARSLDLAVAIAVVDEGGHLILFIRMDGANTGSIEISIAKARSSVMFKRPTARFDAAVVGGAIGLLSLPDVVPFGGGIPLMSDGHIVGGVGVSGASSQDDSDIAQSSSAVM
jgi:uncharacterized protein GlcG (DUF336 family)